MSTDPSGNVVTFRKGLSQFKTFMENTAKPKFQRFMMKNFNEVMGVTSGNRQTRNGWLAHADEILRKHWLTITHLAQKLEDLNETEAAEQVLVFRETPSLSINVPSLAKDICKFDVNTIKPIQRPKCVQIDNRTFKSKILKGFKESTKNTTDMVKARIHIKIEDTSSIYPGGDGTQLDTTPPCPIPLFSRSR